MGKLPLVLLHSHGVNSRVLDYQHLAPALVRQEIKKEDILARLSLSAIFVSHIPPPFEIPKDPDDEAILACAVSAGALFLVTGDKALLAVAEKSPAPIVTASEFKKLFAEI